MSYLRDLGSTSPDLTQTMSADDLLASFRPQPTTEKLKALASWHAHATRWYNLAQAKAAANSKWTSKWKNTFGLGAAFITFAVTLSKASATKAYQKGAQIGSWLASHQDAPDDLKNDLKNTKFFLELIAKGSDEYGVDPNATPSQIQQVVKQMQNAPRPVTVTALQPRRKSSVLVWAIVIGGVVLGRKLFNRRR